MEENKNINNEETKQEAVETEPKKEVPLDLWIDAQSQQLEVNIVNTINGTSLPMSVKKLVVRNLMQNIMSQLDQSLGKMYSDYQKAED